MLSSESTFPLQFFFRNRDLKMFGNDDCIGEVSCMRNKVLKPEFKI